MQGCEAKVYLGSTIRGFEGRIGEVGLDIWLTKKSHRKKHNKNSSKNECNQIYRTQNN